MIDFDYILRNLARNYSSDQPECELFELLIDCKPRKIHPQNAQTLKEFTNGLGAPLTRWR